MPRATQNGTDAKLDFGDYGSITLQNVDAGELNDLLHAVEGTEGDDTLLGTSLDDWLYGLGGNDYASGGFNGDDHLYGGAADDNLLRRRMMKTRSTAARRDDYLQGASDEDTLYRRRGRR